MTTDAIREAMEVVRNTAHGRTYVRRTADGEHRSYLDDCELLARWLVANAGELVRVKGLEWENFFDDADAQYFAKTIFGMYRACRYEWSFEGKATRTFSLTESKSACEAHYRARLAAALEPLFGESGK